MKKMLFIAGYALIGWAICGTTIGVGQMFFDMQATLVVHAMVAPLTFATLSTLFFRKIPDSPPAQTAAIFLAIVVAMDVLLVAPVFEHSFSMFKSALGTWFPFASIFIAVFAVGSYIGRPAKSHNT